MKKPLVLVVDDDRLSILLTKRVIKKIYSNLEVLDFSEPKKALEFLKRDCDLISQKIFIFLDINMPLISGWEFLELLPEDGRDIRVILLTSSINAADREKSLNYKIVSHFATKPLSLSKLKKIRCLY